MSIAIPEIHTLPIRKSAPTRFWGLDAVALHDRYWTSRGVQVIRFGVPVVDRGPQFYLLLDQTTLVFFDLDNVVDRMNWFNPMIVRMRLTDAGGPGYLERVVANDHRLVRFQRVYHREKCRIARVWITPDTRIAREWSASRSAREGRERLAIRSKARRTPRPVLPMSICGRLFRAEDEPDADSAILWLQRVWRTPQVVVDGIYEYAPQVWLHESVRLPKDVELVGPLWMGANLRLRAGEIIVGPGGIPDDGPAPCPSPHDWSETRIPSWSMKSRGVRSDFHRITKRVFDIGAAVFALLLTAPLYPIIMLSILLEDGGPVFFSHQRQTLGGRNFGCLKFRTMCRDAEKMKRELQKQNRCDGPQFFVKDDPRLLRIGRLLRRFQLDEIPQFWNVLRGDMSIVGPRPSPDSENQCCPVWREARLSVRPGVTGLWQVRRTRRPQTDFQEWIRYDLEYVQRQSWRLDIWIIWKTIAKAILGEGEDVDEAS